MLVLLTYAFHFFSKFHICMYIRVVIYLVFLRMFLLVFLCLQLYAVLWLSVDLTCCYSLDKVLYLSV